MISLTLAILLTLSLIGCADDDSSTAKSPVDGTTDTGLSGKLSVWSWGADAEAQARKDAVQVFIDAHPELEIEHIVLPTADSVWDQKAAAAFSAGNAGDVMQMSPDYYGLNTRYYEDLRPYVEKEGVDLESVIVDGMIDGYYTPSGKLEAMP